MQISFFAPPLAGSASPTPAAAPAADSSAGAAGDHGGGFASLLDSHSTGAPSQKAAVSSGNPRSRSGALAGNATPRRGASAAAQDQSGTDFSGRAAVGKDSPAPAGDDAVPSGDHVPSAAASVSPATSRPAPEADPHSPQSPSPDRIQAEEVPLMMVCEQPAPAPSVLDTAASAGGATKAETAPSNPNAAQAEVAVAPGANVAGVAPLPVSVPLTASAVAPQSAQIATPVAAPARALAGLVPATPAGQAAPALTVPQRQAPARAGTPAMAATNSKGIASLAATDQPLAAKVATVPAVASAEADGVPVTISNTNGSSDTRVAGAGSPKQSDVPAAPLPRTTGAPSAPGAATTALRPTPAQAKSAPNPPPVAPRLTPVAAGAQAPALQAAAVAPAPQVAAQPGAASAAPAAAATPAVASAGRAVVVDETADTNAPLSNTAPDVLPVVAVPAAPLPRTTGAQSAPGAATTALRPTPAQVKSAANLPPVVAGAQAPARQAAAGAQVAAQPGAASAAPAAAATTAVASAGSAAVADEIADTNALLSNTEPDVLPVVAVPAAAAPRSTASQNLSATARNDLRSAAAQMRKTMTPVPPTAPQPQAPALGGGAASLPAPPVVAAPTPVPAVVEAVGDKTPDKIAVIANDVPALAVEPVIPAVLVPAPTPVAAMPRAAVVVGTRQAAVASAPPTISSPALVQAQQSGGSQPVVVVPGTPQSLPPEPVVADTAVEVADDFPVLAPGGSRLSDLGVDDAGARKVVTPVASAFRGLSSLAWRTIDQARATGAQVALQNSNVARSNAAAPVTMPAPADGAAFVGSSLANPMLTSPTLAQVLVETGAVSTPKMAQPAAGKTPTVAAPVVVGTPIPAAPTLPATAVVPSAPERGVAMLNTPDRAAAEAPVEPMPGDTTPSAELPVRGLREILAATPVRTGRFDSPTTKATNPQNFLPVDKQRVGEPDGEVGTSGAKRAQSMPLHAPASSFADAALETFELPGAAAPAASVATAASAKPAADPAGSRSTAAAAVREVMNIAEKAQEAGRTHLELRLPTQDNEGLRVHLDWRDGVVHARFVSPNTELQRALSREWETEAPRFAEKGLKFSEPSFERNGHHSDQQSAQTGFTSDQQRNRSRGQTGGEDDLPEFALPTAPAQGSASARSIRAAASTPTTVNTSVPADTRGLRVWA